MHSIVSWSGKPGAAISDAFGGGTAILFIIYSGYGFYDKRSRAKHPERLAHGESHDLRA